MKNGQVRIQVSKYQNWHFSWEKIFDPIIYDSVAALRRVPKGCLIVRVKEGAIIDHIVVKYFLKYVTFPILYT